MDRATRPTPIWPFLSILLCLFVLSLSAPRGWERIAHNKAVGRLCPQSPPQLAQAPSQPKVAREVAVAEPRERTRPAPAVEAAAESPAPASAMAASATVERLPAVDAPAAMGPALDPALIASRGQRRPWRAAAAPLPVMIDPALLFDPLALPRVGAAPRSPQAPIAWRQPSALLRALDVLVGEPEVGLWALRVSSLVRELADGVVSPEERSAALAALQATLAQGESMAAELGPAPAAGSINRVRHALARRIAVWQAASRDERAGDARLVAAPDPHRLSLALAEVDAQFDGSDVAKGWREYLMVESLRELGSTSSGPDPAQSELAAKILARLERAGLSAGQRRFIDDGPLAALAAELRPWAARPIEGTDVLAAIEQYELTGSTTDASTVAHLARTLSWSADEAWQELAEHLESHYRNANLRIAVSQELLERFLPAQPAIEMQVRDTILGLPVRGRSTVHSQTRIRLTPDEARLRLALEASGLISATTGTMAGPATVFSNSSSHYRVQQRITVGSNGLKVAPPQANVNTNLRVRGIRTDFDRVPLLGMVAQQVAQNQQQESSPAARRESENKIARQAAERLDREAGDRLREAAAQFEQHVCEPLVALGLDPRVVQLQTTDSRLAARVRLAGQHQLGAHTPRPQAPSDSVASAQIHESAANNLLAALELDGRRMSLSEAHAYIRAKLGRPEKPAPAELRDDVVVQFAERDAIQVRCQDGVMRLALAIAEMSAEGRRWRNFTVYVHYRPSFNGDRPELVRDGVIQLTGARLSTKSQVALRGVFSKVFARDKALPLVPPRLSDDPRFEGLTLTQFVVVDGWIGLAMGPDRPLPQAAVVRR